MKRTLFYACSLLVILAAGCSMPEYKRPDFSLYIWPLPPEPTRIRLVDVIMTSMDLRKPTANEMMFGATAEMLFRKPTDVVVDKRGIAYVSDTVTGHVIFIDLKNKAYGNFLDRTFAMPFGLGYSSELDWLGVTEPGTRSVSIIQLPQGRQVLTLRADFINPVDVAIDGVRGRIYVADSMKSVIKVFDLKGKPLPDLAAPGSDPGYVHAPLQLTLDKEGRLYVVDSMNWRVEIFSPEGKFLQQFGEHGDQVGMFARPKGIALDSDGHVYITDAAFGIFLIKGYSGQNYLAVGGTGSAPGQLTIPEGIFIDQSDKIYVVDQQNRRLEIYQYIKVKDAPAQAGIVNAPAQAGIVNAPAQAGIVNAPAQAGIVNAPAQAGAVTPTAGTPAPKSN